MEVDSQQGKGSFPVFCIECHMYDYLSAGQKSWVCDRCNELLALRKQVLSLEAKVADLEKQREIVRQEKIFRDAVGASHSMLSSSPVALENGDLGQGGHQSMEEGQAPLVGTPSLEDVPISSCTEDTSPRVVGGKLLVVGDSIVRNIERRVCDGSVDRMVNCLPGAKVADITRLLDRLIDSAGVEPTVVVHVGTNDIGKAKRKVLEAKFRLLGRRLKSRTSKVAFSEMLPVPRAGTARQAELRSFNAWMRQWCREEGFRFIRNWETFWDKPHLYKRDGLHLNHNGTRLLAINIKKVSEQLLN